MGQCLFNVEVVRMQIPSEMRSVEHQLLYFIQDLHLVNLLNKLIQSQDLGWSKGLNQTTAVKTLNNFTSSLQF
jgi:hypothetical protein